MGTARNGTSDAATGKQSRETASILFRGSLLEPLTKPGTKKRDTTGALSASYVHVLHSSCISKLYIDAAVDDPRAIIANRVAEKTSKHAAGSSERNRTFLPWVFTTFGGIGPPSVLHLIDTHHLFLLLHPQPPVARRPPRRH